MKTLTIGWLNKCRCGNKSHTVKTARGNESGLWDDDAVKCNSCGRSGVIQVCEGQARVLWETYEEMAEGKPMSTITIDPRDEFEKVFPIPSHVIRCGKGYACTEYNAWGGHDFIRKWEGWSAAMLQGARNHPEDNLDMVYHSGDANEKGNSPVIPDGWVMVPVEPTEEMNKAGWEAMNEHDAINPTYRAMLAAAPQQEVKP